MRASLQSREEMKKLILWEESIFLRAFHLEHLVRKYFECDVPKRKGKTYFRTIASNPLYSSNSSSLRN